VAITAAQITDALRGRAEGRTWRELAQAEGVSVHALEKVCRTWLRRRGLPTSTTGRGHWRPLPPDASAVAVAVAVVNAGGTLAEAVARSKLTRAQVRRVIKEDRMKAPKTEASYLSSLDVAALLNVQPRLIYELVDASAEAKIDLPAVDVGTGSRRILRWRPYTEDLESWLKEINTWRASRPPPAAPSKSAGAKRAAPGPKRLGTKPPPKRSPKASTTASATKNDLRKSLDG
jgi:hypothetical protein